MEDLVTIRTINSIQSIPNADAIELAIVDGWQCVVKKGEFNVGSKILYFRLDSILPSTDPRFSFMERVNYRVKTIKLRGQLSQGIVLSLSDFPELDLDADLAEQIGVTKYEPKLPTSTSGNMEGNFPSFVPKTDQERVQNLLETIPKYHWNNFFITEKLDGTSFTCFLNFDEEGTPDFGLCSRNWRMKHDGSSIYSQIVTKYDLQNKMIKQNRAIAIQGEIIGPGIQKNLYKLPEVELRVFSIFDILNQRYFTFDIVQAISNSLGLETVPLISNFNTIRPFDLQNILQIADGNSLLNSDSSREGLVFHSKINNFSFKAISNEWLLKNE